LPPICGEPVVAVVAEQHEAAGRVEALATVDLRHRRTEQHARLARGVLDHDAAHAEHVVAARGRKARNQRRTRNRCGERERCDPHPAHLTFQPLDSRFE